MAKSSKVVQSFFFFDLAGGAQSERYRFTTYWHSIASKSKGKGNVPTTLWKAIQPFSLSVAPASRT